jgi:ABC-type glutathione transport system ATPase component
LPTAGKYGPPSRAEARELAIAALREVAIPEPERRWRDYPHQLSGGQRQRVMIAMAIVNRPALLIADEPTGNLDSENGANILALLAELNLETNIAILLATHSPEIASASDRIVFMKDGLVERVQVRERAAK